MPRQSGGERRDEPNEQTAGSTQTGSANDPSQAGSGHGTQRWVANAAVRTGLTIIGVVLLLFALGQAVGLPLLELFVDAVSSEMGRWLLVALFALLLIVAAQRGLPTG